MNFIDLYKKVKAERLPIVVTYGGRFQPAGKHHFHAYEHLQQKFGVDPIMTTSNKVEEGKSPFNFAEKKKIITKMFPIQPHNVVEVKNNYNPQEVLSRLSEETVFIAAIGEKDADRLKGGKYFEDFSKATELKGWKEKGYYYVVPLIEEKFEGELMSGTLVRDVFKSEDREKKERLFLALYGRMDKTIFTLLKEKLS
jgi:hypothetical protein